MRFLGNGDFYFPFDWMLYVAKHIFIWSFQSGTPNPDGLIRLPGRLLHFFVYGLTGNIGFSYFYLFSSLAIAFAAFFFFAKYFLSVKKTSVLITGSLFFACNPIFLGNLAKVGLVLAAAMLPLCLLAIRAAFAHKRFRYFLLLLLCLNISFLHPYTFTVNLGVSAAYLFYMAWRHRSFVRDNVHKFVLIGVVGILCNLYFILPLLSMGTVSKDVISTNVTPSPVDYTALVGISNTGDFFTGFSLSKNVFKDFEFYNGLYQSIYFCGVFLLYVLLLGLYLRVERRLSPSDKRLVGLFFAAFLACIALAATTVFHLDRIIEFLISMPGGWAFRSPLKWQLYIPLPLFGILVILLYRVTTKLKLWLTGLAAVFVLMNAFLLVDVYRKILTPRTLSTFGALMQRDMKYKNVLFINSGPCMDFMRANPRVTTELNQVFTSKNTQLKHVLADNVSVVNLGSYDYLLDCKDGLQKQLEKYRFTRQQSFAGGTFQLYENQKPTGAFWTPETVYALDHVQDVNKKYDFVTQVLDKNFAFVTPQPEYPATSLTDAMSGLMPGNLHDKTITMTVPAAAEGIHSRQLRIRKPVEPLFYQLNDNQLVLSPTVKAGFQTVPDKSIALPLNKPTNIMYEDTAFKADNLLENGSFEAGLWERSVKDCHNYDEQPAIGMRLSREHTHGRQSLQLEARRHIACTGPPQAIAVKPGGHYLLSFDYQSEQGKYAGYYAAFDDPDKTVVSERMQRSGDGWQSFSKELAVPEAANTVRIMLYAYPDTYGEKKRTVRYDNASLIGIPPMADRFYITDTSQTPIRQPKEVTSNFTNPTKRSIHIEGAAGPFHLASAESYSPLWRLKVAGGQGIVPNKQHIKLNNTMNGWYVEPDDLCRQGGCRANPDGSYDFTLLMEFEPQKQFYKGAVISGLTFAGGAAYFIYSQRRDRKTGGNRWRWR